MPSDRDTARSIIEPTASVHGWAIVDADELALMRTNLACAVETIATLLDSPSPADIERARAILAVLRADETAEGVRAGRLD